MLLCLKGCLKVFYPSETAVALELISLDSDFDLATVPVRKAALVRVVGEHVPVLDFKCFTDAIGHGQVPRVFPKRCI